jgi:hypothetical protein
MDTSGILMVEAEIGFHRTPNPKVAGSSHAAGTLTLTSKAAFL